MELLKSYEDTVALGKWISIAMQAGDILLLEGDLGVGKTTFTQGLAEGLGVKEYVNSPTFVIIDEYFSGRLPLYHMDFYRIEDENQLYDLGVEEYFFGNGICVIEWPDIARPLLPDEYTSISLAHATHGRLVQCSFKGKSSQIKEAFDEYFSV